MREWKRAGKVEEIGGILVSDLFLKGTTSLYPVLDGQMLGIIVEGVSSRMGDCDSVLLVLLCVRLLDA